MGDTLALCCPRLLIQCLKEANGQRFNFKKEDDLDNGKKRIIVIDDDKSILRTFTRILQKNGYEIDVAETGKEALEKSKKKPYDLALIDIRLPDMDGTDLLS